MLSMKIKVEVVAQRIACIRLVDQIDRFTCSINSMPTYRYLISQLGGGPYITRAYKRGMHKYHLHSSIVLYCMFIDCTGLYKIILIHKTYNIQCI